MHKHFVRLSVVVTSLIAVAIASPPGAFAEEGASPMSRPGRGMLGGMRPGGGRMGPGMGVMRVCRQDVETLCAGKRGPEALSCLDDQAKAGKLSSECSEAHGLQKKRQELMKSEREAVLAACKSDIDQFCKEDKVALRCLHRKSRDASSGLSQGCTSRMKESQEKMKKLRDEMRSRHKKFEDSSQSGGKKK